MPNASEAAEEVSWSSNLVQNHRRLFPDGKSLWGRSLYQLFGTFSERHAVAIIVGAGPSLDRNISVLQKLTRDVSGDPRRPSAIIFSTDGALAPLLARGIEPDYVIVLEEVPQSRIFTLDCRAGGAPLICPISAYPGLIEAYQESNPGGSVLFYGNRNENKYPAYLEARAGEPHYPLVPWIAGFTNSVSMMALAIARKMGIRRCFLTGCDYSAPEEGPTHCAGFRLSHIDMDQSDQFYRARVRSMMDKHLRNLHAIPDRNLLDVWNCSEGGVLDWNNLPLSVAGERYGFITPGWQTIPVGGR